MWLVSCECSVQWTMHVCVCAHVYTSVVCGCMCVCIECSSAHSFVCTAANEPRQPSSIFVATSSSA